MTKKLTLNFQYMPDDSVTVLSLPNASSLRAVKDAWSQKTELKHEEHIFLLNGRRLPNHGQLAEHIESGSVVLIIKVKPYLEQTIENRSFPEQSTTACIDRDARVEEVLSQVRRNLGLGNRALALLHGDRRLTPNKSPNEQGVPSDAQMSMDFVFIINMRTVAALDFQDPKSDEDLHLEPHILVHEARRLECLGKDPAFSLLSDNLPSSRQRLLIGTRKVNIRESVVRALPPNHAFFDSLFDMDLEHSIPIVVQRDGSHNASLSEMFVWPCQKVQILTTDRTEAVFREGARIDLDETFINIDARCHNHFKVTKMIALTVRDSHCNYHVIHVPRKATVDELRWAIGMIEPGGDFNITVNGFSLKNGARTITEFGVEDGAEIILYKGQTDVGIQNAETTKEAGVQVGNRRKITSFQTPSGSNFEAERQRYIYEIEKQKKEKQELLEREYLRFADDLLLRVNLLNSSVCLNLQPCDSLGTIFDFLRRGGFLMGVRSVQLPGRVPVSTQPGWRDSSLKDFGITTDSSLEVDPFVASDVNVCTLVPTSNHSTGSWTVNIGTTGLNLDLIRRKAEGMSRLPLQFATAVQRGSLYSRNRVTRRSIDSFNPVHEEFQYLDEDDGQEEDQNNRTHTLLNILSSRCGIAAAPSESGRPSLEFFTSSEVCTVGEDGLIPSHQDLLFDRRAALLLRGLSVKDIHGITVGIKLWLNSGSLFDVDTTEIFASAEAACSRWKASRSIACSYLWIPIMDGDRVPGCRLPNGQLIFVYRRSGVTVAVKDGRVTMSGVPRRLTGSRWMKPVTADSLDQKLSDAMHRGKNCFTGSRHDGVERRHSLAASKRDY